VCVIWHDAWPEISLQHGIRGRFMFEVHFPVKGKDLPGWEKQEFEVGET